MSQSKRAKRPKIERAAPRRNFAGAFAGAKNGAADKNGVPKPNGANGAHANPTKNPEWTEARDASYEAINNGYRVIDEYMRQGQRLAEEFWLPSPDERSVGSDFTRMMERFLRSAGDMGGAWLEMMTEWSQAPGRDVGGPRGTAGPFSAGSVSGTVTGTEKGANGVAAPASGPAEASTSLSIVVESSRKVRLSVESRALSPGVVVHSLVCSNPEVRPITSAAIGEGPSGGAALHVVVPDDQPAGVYYGVLVDTGTGRPAGTVTLTVL
jgi:hypothetical protein